MLYTFLLLPDYVRVRVTRHDETVYVRECGCICVRVSVYVDGMESHICNQTCFLSHSLDKN